MAFSSDFLLSLFYVFIIGRICNCQPISNLTNVSYVSKWFYSPEKEKFIIRNISSIFSRENINSYTPMEETISNNTIGIIDIPQCPGGASYCENIPNYPYQLLYSALKSKNIKKSLFRNENLLINLRDLGVFEEDTVCKSIREVIRPMVASNNLGKQKFIINVEKEEEFVQEIYLEKCQPGTGLASRCGFNPPTRNKRSGCKQKYLDWRLLTFSTDGEISFDTFSFPSGCSCIYTLIN